MTQQKTQQSEQQLDSLLTHLNPSVAIGVAAGVAAGVAGKWLWDNSDKVTMMIGDASDQAQEKFDEFSHGRERQPSAQQRQGYWEEDRIDGNKMTTRRIPIH
jgi:hypothetical protein